MWFRPPPTRLSRTLVTATDAFRAFSDDPRKGSAMFSLAGHAVWVIVQTLCSLQDCDPSSTDLLASSARDSLPLVVAFVRRLRATGGSDDPSEGGR